MVFGCQGCQSEFWAKINGRRVCYYCGGNLSDFEMKEAIEIPLGDDLGEPIVADQIITIDDVPSYDYND